MRHAPTDMYEVHIVLLNDGAHVKYAWRPDRADGSDMYLFFESPTHSAINTVLNSAEDSSILSEQVNLPRDISGSQCLT